LSNKFEIFLFRFLHRYWNFILRRSTWNVWY